MNNTGYVVKPDLSWMGLFENSTTNLVFIIPVVLLYLLVSLYIAHKKVVHQHTITVYDQKNSENVEDV